MPELLAAILDAELGIPPLGIQLWDVPGAAQPLCVGKKINQK